MSASYDPAGTIQWYFVHCGGGSFTPGSQSPNGICTFNTPGAYWLMLQVQDNAGNVDILSTYVVATPPAGGGDLTPPVVSLTSPPAGPVSGDVSLAANATDASGISKVDFYRSGGVLLGTDSSSPYGITWDSGATAPGPYSVYAVATDNNGNTGTSSSVNITVNAPTPPLASITSPTGPTVPRKSKVTITASATRISYDVARVDILVGSTVICSDATTPYSCTWSVPGAANKTYQLSAKAYDTKGNVGTSATVTVTSK
jgi:hypothetical protein